MDVSLILYAEHEFNASTFTARVVVSTLSDLHSAHRRRRSARSKARCTAGRTNAVMEVLEQVGRPEDNAEAWIRDALAAKRRIMGFGHRVYKDGRSAGRVSQARCARNWPRKPATRHGSNGRHDRTHRSRREEAAAESRLAHAPALPLPGPAESSFTRRCSWSAASSAGVRTSSSSSTTTA